MEEEKYPSWRDALFNRDTVANIRCAIKYVIWHTGYMLLTVIGVALMAVAVMLKGIAKIIPGSKIQSGVERGLDALINPLARAVDWFNSSRAKNFAEGAAAIMLLGGIVVFIGFLLYMIWVEPVVMLTTIFTVIVGVIACIVIMEAFERYGPSAGKKIGSGINTAKSKAVETPGVRRVYGECPVHFDIEPKWFGKIDDAFEKVFE